MQSPLNLMHQVLLDASDKCATHPCIKRDFDTIKKRYEHEGLSFLTITLPAFLESFVAALEHGGISPTSFSGWKKKACLPAFLQGFTRLVFNKEGKVENESVTSIHCVRQICSIFKKIKLPCTEHRRISAFDQYCDVDAELDTSFNNIPDSFLDTFVNVSGIFCTTLFPTDVDLEELIPHHGPGSTQEKITGNKKYKPDLYPWVERLSQYFRPEEVLFSSAECCRDSSDNVVVLGLSSEPPVRVVSVPKTLKTPRIIALEPTSVQMCQQSVKDVVVKVLEANDLTRGHINFTDQSINQRLALESSLTRKLCTLDLSAASDRIHKDLIYLMLKTVPVLRGLAFSTRSRYAEVDGKSIFLNKFASMGSAMCFPMEALFFTILCCMGILRNRQLDPTLKNIKCVIKSVFVYGDDIIVPVDDVAAVVETLTVFGNVVGQSKSFVKGGFRESCGVDAYNGKNVTPIYIRQALPTARNQASRIVSTIETANQLFKIGFAKSAQYLVGKVHALTGPLPVVTETCEGIGWHFPVKTYEKTRFNRKLQRSEVKTFVTSIRKEPDVLDGYNALTKCLLKLQLAKPTLKSEESWAVYRYKYDTLNSVDTRHLSETPCFGTLTLKRQWVANLY